MPAGSLEAEEILFQATGRQHRIIPQSRAPEDGRNHRPKHDELNGIINKPLLLHLVGCLHYLVSYVLCAYWEYDEPRKSPQEVYYVYLGSKIVYWVVKTPCKTHN